MALPEVLIFSSLSLSCSLSLPYVSNMLYINEEIFFSLFLLSQIVSVHVQTVACS